MPIDRKALKQRMKDKAASEQAAVKSILFPLPDLKGPGGNAFALLGQAKALMKGAHVSETMQTRFSTEAMKGDYPNLLDTIQTWFTVVVQSTEYHPITGDIRSLIESDSGLSWDDIDAAEDKDAEESPEADAAMNDYESRAEDDRRVAEIQDRVSQQIRAELGLSDDEVVIVQIKKKKG